MKRFFPVAIIFSILLILLSSCWVYPEKSKTYSRRSSAEFLYGVKIFAGVYGNRRNGGDVYPYQLIISYEIKNSICKVVTFEEVIVNKGKYEYRNDDLFSSVESDGNRYDLPKEFNMEDMDDIQSIYISLKVKFELSDGQVKEEWLGFIVDPDHKTQWLNMLISV